MSGANIYFQNTASENLASQGAIFGFDGLTVVGETTLIGSLNATGGITSTTLTANNIISSNMTGGSGYFNSLNLSYSSSTGSAGTVTSNTSRGKIMIPSGSTSATVTNNLVTVNSSVFSSITPRLAGEFIEGIDVLNGSFTIHLNSSSGSDIYLNWIVFN
jgi:hypothetical protein